MDCTFFVLFFVFFLDRVSLCSPGCPGTHSVDQDGLKLRNPPATPSGVLGLKAFTTTVQLHKVILKIKNENGFSLAKAISSLEG